MKIGIFPKIIEPYKDQIEFSVDIRFKEFFKSIFSDISFNIVFDENDVKNFDLIIISGGNDIVNNINSSKLKDIIRDRISKKIIKKTLQLNLPILGICYGAQIIAKIFKSKLSKKKHVGSHKVYFNNIFKNKSVIVNSYHNTVIKKLGRDLISIATAKDKSIEAFTHNKKKILCIQWHPERNLKVNKIDKYLLNMLCQKK